MLKEKETNKNPLNKIFEFWHVVLMWVIPLYDNEVNTVRPGAFVPRVNRSNTSRLFDGIFGIRVYLAFVYVYARAKKKQLRKNSIHMIFFGVSQRMQINV